MPLTHVSNRYKATNIFDYFWLNIHGFRLDRFTDMCLDRFRGWGVLWCGGGRGGVGDGFRRSVNEDIFTGRKDHFVAGRKWRSVAHVAHLFGDMRLDLLRVWNKVHTYKTSHTRLIGPLRETNSLVTYLCRHACQQLQKLFFHLLTHYCYVLQPSNVFNI